MISANDNPQSEIPPFFDLKVLPFNGKLWMSIDDIIEWLKINQKQSPEDEHVFHFLIKSLVKMKNEK